MICVIVLHYKNSEATRRCVESVLRVMEADSKILVVDNGSCDGSGERLAEMFRADARVRVMIGKDRLGFSAGNNLGFGIAKEYGPEFVVDLNNDVMIEQADFFARLREVYKETGFDVMGPDIYVPETDEHQSPYRLSCPSRSGVEKGIRKYGRQLKELENPSFGTRFGALIQKYCPRWIALMARKRQNRRQNEKNGIDYRKAYSPACVKGSCVVFSPSFIAKYDRLFEPETDFYFEEEILMLKCRKDRLTLVYDPRCQILHLHGGGQSIAQAYSDILKRKRFMCESFIRSMGVYLEYLGDREPGE